MSDTSKRIHEPRVLLATGDGDLLTELGHELKLAGIAVTVWTPDRRPPVAPGGGFHLVLLDADDLPGLEGKVGLLTRKQFGVSVVFAIGTEPPREILLKLLELGVDRFFHKPIEVNELALASSALCVGCCFGVT